MSGINFEPGQIVATPGALEAFRASGDDPLAYVVRHIAGDWGDVDEHDKKENELRWSAAGESCLVIGSVAKCESGSLRKLTGPARASFSRQNIRRHVDRLYGQRPFASAPCSDGVGPGYRGSSFVGCV